MTRTHYIYGIRDRISGTYQGFIMAVNIAMAIRENYRYIRQDPNFADLEIWEMAEFDNKSGEIKAHAPIQHDWNEYEFPENKTEEKKEEKVNG